MIPKRLLLTAEAGTEVAPAAVGGGTVETQPAVITPAWYAPAETLKTSDPATWESFEKGVKAGNHKDLPTVLSHMVGLEKKLGTALTLPNKDKPEEVAAFKQKMIDAGIIAKPPVLPGSADQYEVKLDAIPEPMRSEPTVKALKEWAHKNGITNEAVNELIALEAQRYTEVVEPALKYTAEQGLKAVADFAASIGKEPKEVEAYGAAWLTKNFTEEEVQAMEASGFANSPVALKYAARAGLDTGEDISVISGMGSAVDTEFNDFMKNLSDPKHPDNALYMKGDPQDPKRVALMAKRETLLKAKYGTGEAK